MKTTCYFLSVIGLVCLLSCTANKYVISDSDLSNDKVLVLGVVEYDYSQLENKNLNGLSVILDSDGRNLDVQLPEMILQNNGLIRQELISSIGNYGVYSLFNEPNVAMESDNIFTVVKTNKSLDAPSRNVIREYDIENGKIVNIGKVVVKYTGGKVVDGKIIYSYSFKTNCKDTLALHVFKESNPMVFEKYANEVLSCNDEK